MTYTTTYRQYSEQPAKISQRRQCLYYKRYSLLFSLKMFCQKNEYQTSADISYSGQPLRTPHFQRQIINIYAML